MIAKTFYLNMIRVSMNYGDAFHIIPPCILISNILMIIPSSGTFNISALMVPWRPHVLVPFLLSFGYFWHNILCSNSWPFPHHNCLATGSMHLSKQSECTVWRLITVNGCRLVVWIFLLIWGPFGAYAWWRHQMETFSALLAFCAGNSPVHGEFPAQRPVTRSFDVFFDLRLNKRLSKQSWGWWSETPWSSLWRHRNDIVFTCNPVIICQIISISKSFTCYMVHICPD